MSSGTESLSRSEWVEMFTEGYKIGGLERKRRVEERRSNVENAIEGREGYGPYSDTQKEAVQAGYNLGRKKSFPGASIDVEQKANVAYDKSGHATGLSQWTGDGDE